MNIFGFDISKRVNIEPQNERGLDEDYEDIQRGGSSSGVNVNASSAQKMVAVGACIKVISESIAQISIGVYKDTSNGKELDKTHPVYWMLRNQPNKVMSSATFHQTMIQNVLAYGNAYALIHRTKAVASELEILSPSDVTPKYNKETREIFYKVKGYNEPFNSFDIIHIKGSAPDGLIGLSPLREYANAIGLGIAEQEYASKYFANGANMNAVVTSPKTLTISQVTQVRKMFRETYGGVKNSNSVGVLPDGMDIKTLSFKPTDSQLLESRKFSILEISRIFRVPPHMISELSNATFSNIEHQSLDFVKHTLMPWVVKIEQEYNSKLFKESEKATVTARFNIESLMRGDTISRNQMYIGAIQNGWLNRNEVRQLEGFNKYEGGDEFLYPMNLTNGKTPETTI